MADRSNTEALFGKTLNHDGSLRAVSPSQVIAFQRCGLRWHFDKKGRLQKKPMGKGAAIGDAAHGRTETFANTGQDVRGPLELVGAKMLAPYLWALPFNKGPAVVEGALLNPRLQTPGGVLITGYFDLYVPGLHGRESGFEWPTIIDHKFKKDLAKWGYVTDEVAAERMGLGPTRAESDREKLSDDPQTVSYGTWALTKQPEADGVVMRHHQVQTEGPGGRFPLVAEVRLTRNDLLRRWGAMAQVIDGPMAAAARVPAAMPGATPEGVPYNDMACGDFGGCDFARTCRHSPMNKFTAMLRDTPPGVTGMSTPTNQGTNPMGLLDQITGKTAPSTPQTAPQMVAALTASIASGPQSVGHPDVPLMAEIPISAAKPGTVYLIAGGSPCKFEGVLGSRAIFRARDGGLREANPADKVRTIDEETLCLFEGRPYQKATPASVPAAQTPGAPSNANAAGAGPALDPAKEEKARKLGIVDLSTTPDKPGGVVPPDVAPSPASTVVVTGAPATPAPEVKVTTAEATAPAAPAEPKKRGRKSNAQKAAQVGGAMAEAATDDSIEAEASGTKPLFLLVDCTSNRAADLSSYVKNICDEVAKRFQAPDVRLGHQKSDLAFGGWKALIALEAAKNPPQGLCSIQSSELADPVIEALVPLAALVVYPRGVR